MTPAIRMWCIQNTRTRRLYAETVAETRSAAWWKYFSPVVPLPTDKHGLRAVRVLVTPEFK